MRDSWGYERERERERERETPATTLLRAIKASYGDDDATSVPCKDSR